MSTACIIHRVVLFLKNVPCLWKTLTSQTLSFSTRLHQFFSCDHVWFDGDVAAAVVAVAAAV